MPALIMVGGYAVIFAGAEGIARRFTLDPEVGRKISHVASGTFGLLLPVLFEGWLTVALLGLLFGLFLFYSQQRGLISSIHGVDRVTSGEVFFPIGMAGIFALSWFSGRFDLYVIALLVLTIGDTAAWYVGSRFGRHSYTVNGDRKSLEGSVAMAVATALIVIILIGIGQTNSSPDGVRYSWVAAPIAGVIGALVEVGSPRGLDNLSIPVGVWATLYFLSS